MLVSVRPCEAYSSVAPLVNVSFTPPRTAESKMLRQLETGVLDVARDHA